ncbi:MAG: hypothetical protein L3J18_06715 [Candidatus Brocadia sp.]|uniref:Uncharacterized protein n=1 Tax=Candidatus Brocadia fulgida TaxID=380242 RepID=A0A0M2URT6_9BACT|nr:MAG: hypothetical protein BROFUL_02725 [Candidatus Brocadia fulgida]UJS21996.1 MAG: hypothetical protein L3J18_06715 [Candidatus Brocadia sp.]
MAQVFSGSDWLSTHWNELREFNNSWIVVNPEGFVDSRRSLDDLMAAIRERRLDISRLTFAFVTFDVRVRE